MTLGTGRPDEVVEAEGGGGGVFDEEEAAGTVGIETLGCNVRDGEGVGGVDGSAAGIGNGVGEVDRAVGIRISLVGPGAVLVLGEGALGGTEVGDLERIRAIGIGEAREQLGRAEGNGGVFCCALQNGLGG